MQHGLTPVFYFFPFFLSGPRVCRLDSSRNGILFFGKVKGVARFAMFCFVELTCIRNKLGIESSLSSREKLRPH